MDASIRDAMEFLLAQRGETEVEKADSVDHYCAAKMTAYLAAKVAREYSICENHQSDCAQKSGGICTCISNNQQSKQD